MRKFCNALSYYSALRKTLELALPDAMFPINIAQRKKTTCRLLKSSTNILNATSIVDMKNTEPSISPMACTECCSTRLTGAALVLMTLPTFSYLKPGRPALSIGGLTHQLSQRSFESLTRNFKRTHAQQVWVTDLAIEYAKRTADQVFAQGDEGDFAGIYLPAEHGFTKKGRADGKTINASGK